MNYILLPLFLSLLFARSAHSSTFDALCGNEKCRVDLSPAGISVGETTIPNDRVLLWSAGGAEPPSHLLGAANTLRGATVGLLIAPVLLGPVGLIWGGLAESGAGDVNPDLYFKIIGCSITGSPSEINLRFLSSSAARRFRMEFPMFTNLVPGQQKSFGSCASFASTSSGV
jgi:hypothetical protein